MEGLREIKELTSWLQKNHTISVKSSLSHIMALTEDQTTVKSISGDRIISDEVQAITTDIT